MIRELDDAQAAHSPFGGSVAARVLRCPASVRLVEKVPVEPGIALGEHP
jgi:hypothetical protein